MTRNVEGITQVVKVEELKKESCMRFMCGVFRMLCTIVCTSEMSLN